MKKLRPKVAAISAGRVSCLCALVAAFLVSAGGRVLAHGDVHEQIQHVTELIAASPGDPLLYLRRAKLHGTHRDWGAAEADYMAARKAGPDLAAVDLAHGEMLRQKGDPAAAIRLLDRCLARDPRNPTALVARGRALMDGGRPLPAADDFAAAMTLGKGADPELCLEHARALSAGGELTRALDSLDAAVLRIGSVVTLVIPAIDLEVRMKRFDAALARLDRFAAPQLRQERWLALRGEILEKAGRPEEARTAYLEAQAAIARLPDDRRMVALVADLERQLTAKLARLGDPPQRTSP